jgi:hypothetical protein
MTSIESSRTSEVASFGIAWAAEWAGQDRLLLRGYRSNSGVNAIAKWDVDSLLATVDGALEAAAWTETASAAARSAIRELYARELDDLE